MRSGRHDPQSAVTGQPGEPSREPRRTAATTPRRVTPARLKGGHGRQDGRARTLAAGAAGEMKSSPRNSCPSNSWHSAGRGGLLYPRVSCFPPVFLLHDCRPCRYARIRVSVRSDLYSSGVIVARVSTRCRCRPCQSTLPPSSKILLLTGGQNSVKFQACESGGRRSPLPTAIGCPLRSGRRLRAACRARVLLRGGEGWPR